MNTWLLLSLVLGWSAFIGISFAQDVLPQWEEDAEHTYLHFENLYKNGIPNLKFYDNRDFKGEPVYELNNLGFWFGKTKCLKWGGGGERPPETKKQMRLSPIWIIATKETLTVNPTPPECLAENYMGFVLSSGSREDDAWVRIARKPSDSIAEVPYVDKTRPELRNAYLLPNDKNYKPWPKDILPSERRTLYLNLKGLPPFTYHLSIIDKNGPERIKAFNDYRQKMHECLQKRDRGCLKKGMADMVGISQDLHKTKECKLLMTKFNAGSQNNQDAALDCIYSDKTLLKNIDGCLTSNNPKYPFPPEGGPYTGSGYQQLVSDKVTCSLDADKHNHWKLSGVAEKEKQDAED